MKVSEKSLELNLGAELLTVFRRRWHMPKAYLRGLTQREESQEGVDFFAQLDPATRLFAFQFKAPRGTSDACPYRFMLIREQHDLLYDLAQSAPNSVFYVLPFYVTEPKLSRDIPVLLKDTWFLRIDRMDTATVFGTTQRKTMLCRWEIASVNPEYKMERLVEGEVLLSRESGGLSSEVFAEWYERYRSHERVARNRRNPQIARGLRVVVVSP